MTRHDPSAWTMRDGSQIAVDAMTPHHARNALAMVARHPTLFASIGMPDFTVALDAMPIEQVRESLQDFLHRADQHAQMLDNAADCGDLPDGCNYE